MKEEFKHVVTPEELESLQILYSKPEKIKAEDIDSKQIAKLGYNIMYGRAGRRHNKSAHFSEMA